MVGESLQDIAQQPQRPFHRKTHSIRSIEANQNATHFDCLPLTLDEYFDIHAYLLHIYKYGLIIIQYMHIYS